MRVVSPPVSHIVLNIGSIETKLLELGYTKEDFVSTLEDYAAWYNLLYQPRDLTPRSTAESK